MSVKKKNSEKKVKDLSFQKFFFFKIQFYCLESNFSFYFSRKKKHYKEISFNSYIFVEKCYNFILKITF